nr:MAG TPA: hypothetical protein [Caudoviricetes sp.]
MTGARPCGHQARALRGTGAATLGAREAGGHPTG